MNCNQMKALTRRLFEALDGNDTETLLEILSPDLVVHNPDPQSREENLQAVARWHTQFSGSRFEILQQVCEGDVVATRVDMHADHTEGQFEGLAPTGRHIVIPAFTFERFQDGRILERRIVSDHTAMRQVLGLPPQSDANGPAADQAEHNKSVVGRFYDAFAANDQRSLRLLLAPEFGIHVPGFPEPVSRELHLKGMEALHTAFAGLHVTFHDQIAMNDLVASRLTWRGTNEGEFRGHPPTGKPVAVAAISLERIQNETIVEHWFYQDVTALQRQIGL